MRSHKPPAKVDCAFFRARFRRGNRRPRLVPVLGEPQPRLTKSRAGSDSFARLTWRFKVTLSDQNLYQCRYHQLASAR